MKPLLICIVFTLLTAVKHEPITGNPRYDFADAIITKNSKSRNPATTNMNDLTVAGYYHEAVKTELSYFGRRDTIKVNYQEQEIIDAKSLILQEAKKYRVMMINESHIRPQHRLFTKSLLKELYDQGYRVFLAEGLQFRHKMDSNYCPIRTDGPLLSEPNNAQLLRYARKLGYKVAAYEYFSKATWDDSVKLDKYGSIRYIGTDPADTLTLMYNENGLQHTYFSSNREQAQTLNAWRVIQANPDAKVIFHVGEGHLSETEGSLGGMLKEMLHGEDILTIDQTWAADRTAVVDIPTYQIIRRSTPYLMRDTKSKKYYHAPDFTSGIDFIVFNDTVKDSLGRPGFLYKDVEKRTVYNVPYHSSDTYPCIVAAYNADEWKRFGDKAIAIDVVCINDRDQPKPLLLYPGKYVVLKKNIAGEYTSFNVKIK